jgi:uncharacterized beta-barrel protein YwiB (DUF1934 family)
MQKNVLISIKGTVIPDGATPDVIELITEGRYLYKEGTGFISYKESETTGFDGVTTTLKVEGDRCVTLTRSGPASTRLILERGKRHLCQYETDVGQLLVGVSGCHILSRLDDGGGELTFNYALDINSSLISQNEVTISVREAQKPVC